MKCGVSGECRVWQLVGPLHFLTLFSFQIYLRRLIEARSDIFYHKTCQRHCSKSTLSCVFVFPIPVSVGFSSADRALIKSSSILGFSNNFRRHSLSLEHLSLNTTHSPPRPLSVEKYFHCLFKPKYEKVKLTASLSYS